MSARPETPTSPPVQKAQLWPGLRQPPPTPRNDQNECLFVSRGRARSSVVGWWQAREWLARRAACWGVIRPRWFEESFPSDGGHVDGVVDPPVPPPGQAVDFRFPEETSIGAVPL
jgi:hypothetical protein